MKLSKYCENNENKWEEDEIILLDKLIKYLNSIIEKDLYEFANTKDSVEVYNILNGWLFNFYKKEFIKGLNYVEIDFNTYAKSLLFGFILSVTNNRSNEAIIYNLLKSSNIIEEVYEIDEETYEIVTNDFGSIIFAKADSMISKDEETLNFINKLGENKKDGCHEITEFLIKQYPDFKAVTSICQKGLNKKYYHSFAIDKENIIDLTNNLIMDKNSYYLLQNVEQLNIVDYKEYLEENNKTIKYDESKTLYNLLRNALYNKYNQNDK